MSFTPIDLITLDKAYLCGNVECNTITKNSRACPACNSQVLNLARLLNPKPQLELVYSRKEHEYSGQAR